MNNVPLQHLQNSHWLTSTPSIDSLKLSELILPGAHNSGVDKKATYAVPGLGHWAACQNNSFLYQLQNGARVLDARLEYDIDARGVGTFWFQHNGLRSSRSLENLIMQLIRFLEENPDEFVLVDFHKLEPVTTTFDYPQLNRSLLTHLGPRLIPTGNRDLTLGQLKKISSVQRIWLAASPHPALDREWFLPQVQHMWSGIGDTSVSELEAHITKVMRAPYLGSMPWSLSATSYSIALGPVNIKEHLDRWFHPDNNWVHSCSIINADFFEDSRLVQHCRTANIIRAQQLHGK
jgi:1-phosphatidylinositol phosphodiesterase